MTKLSAQETRERSITALKTVYYVIIGLAIAEALRRTFLEKGSFLVRDALAPENLTTFTLLFVFLPTICRFLHGASIHLDVYSDKRYKPLCDFIAFFFQASVFYLMAVSLDRPPYFLSLLGLMLLTDALWLLLLIPRGYITWEGYTPQWVKSDFCVIVVLAVLLWQDNALASTWSKVVLLVTAWTATVLDYAMNRDFYFPTEDEEDLANPVTGDTRRGTH